ncbi:endolytic transglycosylase MltG, partial [Candidatus Saccharibacteria bacterium]|nr:endolytic transglycosylase MltG [Candidatus Saccharibacteria bacterium]
ADLLDPNRQVYTDNGLVLEIDSPYNTRKSLGIPPGPICNPGTSALLAVANPTDTSYLYFLTGDDGVMYYSYTEAEHNQNIIDHCRSLCNIQL